jgi:hypothetical protein
LGCRNVTKIYVPKDYDFIPLLHASRKYSYFAGHSRFKNNYDYHLAMHILNNKYYMSNENLLLVEDPSLFSPISQLNYEFYISAEDVIDELKNNKDIQCIVGYGGLPLGKTQQPGLSDYADGEDSLKFLLEL